jgi:hypothetical protein
MEQNPFFHFFVMGHAGSNEDFVSGKLICKIQGMAAFAASAASNNKYNLPQIVTP